jgi:hypothetical protein
LGKVGIVDLSVFQEIDEPVYNWCKETLLIVQSANPILFSNLSFWEVGVGS